MIENDLSLRFNIWDFDDIKHKDITESLNLKPYKLYVKGEPINQNSPRFSKRNGWVYGFPYGSGKDFKEQMDEILTELEPKVFILRGYSQKYICEFSCALFLNNREQSVPWIQLDRKYNAFIREVNAEFDLEIYYPPLEN